MYKQDVDTFLREKRNIRTRHYMAETQATSDLIIPAADQAMKRCGITADQLDLIIVATDTPDYMSPATASVVHRKLKATHAATFDVNAACAGFVTALDIGSKYIQCDARYKNILVVGAYGMTKHLDFNDYKIATLFADGAGAVILQPTEGEDGILATYLWADSQYTDAMGIYSGGTAEPVNADVLQRRTHLLKFLKKIPPEFNAYHWPRVANLLLDQARTQVDQVDHFFLTQINIDSINQTMDALKVQRDKSHNIMDRYGYTGSACIPMAMADAFDQGRLKSGDTLLLIGSGGGVAMGGVLIRWS